MSERHHADLEVGDEPAELEVVESEVVLHGLVWDVRRDTVRLQDGQTVTRDVVVHTGAVGIVALDDDERVLMLRQYRHPVRSYLWEPPAGLLDVKGETALQCAQRELAEEAHLTADEWHVLVDFYNSPGGSEESFRCFLARGLQPVPESDRHEGDGEERDMPIRWLPLDEARDLVLAGRLHNPTSVCGILAAHDSRERGWATLRDGDAVWPERSPGR